MIPLLKKQKKNLEITLTEKTFKIYSYVCCCRLYCSGVVHKWRHTNLILFTYSSTKQHQTFIDEPNEQQKNGTLKNYIFFNTKNVLDWDLFDRKYKKVVISTFVATFLSHISVQREGGGGCNQCFSRMSEHSQKIHFHYFFNDPPPPLPIFHLKSSVLLQIKIYI